MTTLDIELLDLSIFISQSTKVTTLGDSYRSDLDRSKLFVLLHIHLRYGVVGIAPHVRLDSLGVAGEDILPVSFPELAECKVSDLAKLAVALLVSDAAFSEILDREVHTLKLVEKTDISQGAIS